MSARTVAALALIYTAVVLAIALVPPRALGHDEAVYAIGGRGLVDDVRGDDFPLHRSIGMRALAAPGVALGGGERTMRLPFALIALGYLAVVGAIARRRFGAGAAALAMAVIATTPTWQWRAAEILSDIPSALALLGLIGLCGGDGRGWARALAAGACAAAACYLRYASVPVVAAIVAVAFVVDRARWRWLAAVCGCALALWAPFLIWSVARTGSLLGVLQSGERMSQRAYYGQGLVYYARTWPLLLAGPITGAVAAIGIVIGVTAWRGGWAAVTPAQRARRLLATAGLAQIVALGVNVHGEERFIFFGVTALAMVGASWLAERPARWRVALVAVALTAIPSAIWTHLRLARLARSRVSLVEIAAALRADAPDGDCFVFSTEPPTLTWYARCGGIQVETWGLDPKVAAGESRVYLVEAKSLRRSIGDAEAQTRDALGWQPLACDPRWCLWRATRRPAPP